MKNDIYNNLDNNNINNNNNYKGYIWLIIKNNFSYRFSVGILDVNDSPPVFSQSHYSFLVPEGNSFGLRVGAIVAIDADDGENGRLRYSLKIRTSNISENSSDADVLSIDQNSGEIRAAFVFDREMFERYEFRVFAEDAGTPQLTATALITLIVTDQNDNPPHWNSSFTFSVRENERSRIELGTFRAFDRDIGENARLIYRLADRSSDGRFEVDPQRGTLFATGVPLDREHEEVVQLEVCASDSGAPRLETCTLSFVKVLDENDNDPYFVFPEASQKNNCSVIINASIHSPVGLEIWKLSAGDKDTGPNAELNYRIARGDEYRLFHLDLTSGALTVFRSIPAEFIDPLSRLTIVVTDRGVPSREIEVTICVRLLDQPFLSTSPETAARARPSGRSNPFPQGHRAPSGLRNNDADKRSDSEWVWVELLEDQTWFYVFLAISALVFTASFACSIALITRRVLDHYKTDAGE